VTRRPLAALGLMLVAVAAGLLIWRAIDGSSDPGARREHTAVGNGGTTPPTISPTTSTALFPGLTEAQLLSGEGMLRVVIADDEAERRQGLRGRSDLGPFDGMLFVFPESAEAGFTMSTVPIALDIGFYDAQLRRVGDRRMEACAGSESECPTYRSPAPFVYALETPAGRLPAGDLTRLPPS
jgi:uncharacterized membrane protein (UPF0127 family)